MQKELPIPDYQQDGEHRQDSRLDDLAVRMRGKQFIEQIRGDVEDNRHQNVSVGPVVEPVHQDDKGDDAEREIEAVQKPGGCYLAVVVPLDETQWQVPKRPEDSKQQGCGQLVHSSSQAVRAIGMPGQLLKQRRQKQHYPDREDSRRKRRTFSKTELIRAMPEQQGEGLGEENAAEHETARQHQITKSDRAHIEESMPDIVT